MLLNIEVFDIFQTSYLVTTTECKANINNFVKANEKWTRHEMSYLEYMLPVIDVLISQGFHINGNQNSVPPRYADSICHDYYLDIDICMIYVS